jgi:hypothetical protein
MGKIKVQKVTTLIPSTDTNIKIVIGGREIKAKSLMYQEHELCLI